ncbi:alcohol dehydrogenase [Kosmotoga arenicorallina S304]|uniref:Alcohol dehydrogenase n=1 Tax=Kosmotoga arenicorallina S304 TaxID=1453497 RepID=A0A176JZL8_9BACT|nr:iron-containing alcohol dehydrogenase [Kosmotoga arenicorallina]OAA29459.1 alcohol dehydrogenase [Kosmotoga arenicorallina S304]
MYNFKAFLPTKLVFGAKAVEKLPKEVKKLGTKAMIVTGRHSTKKSGLLDRVLTLLKGADISTVVYDRITPNPTTEQVNEAADIAKKEGVQFVIGLGGGSPIDSAKCIAIATTNEGGIWDYVKVGGGKKPKSALPIVAIPTTHGTGTEADPFAVITNPETKTKIGIGYDVIFPSVSLIDPEVMLTLPKNQTAYTSMDAFYHSIEAFLNKNANPYSDLLAIDSMKRIISNLPIAYEDGLDINARTELTWANTEAGITETLTGVIANHAIEHGISGYYPHIAHGFGLCITGPYLFEHIFDFVFERLARVGREVFGIYECDDKRAARMMIGKLKDFQERFGLNKKLSALGVEKGTLGDMVETSYNAMYGVIETTPGDLKKEDLFKILERAF